MNSGASSRRWGSVAGSGGESSPSARITSEWIRTARSGSGLRASSPMRSPRSWGHRHPAAQRSAPSRLSAWPGPCMPFRSSVPRSHSCLRRTPGRSAAALAFAVVVFAPQVAFVSGSFALVRSLRRRERVLPSTELIVINRRTALALLAGLATTGSLWLVAFELRDVADGWWVAFTLAGSATASVLLVLAAVPTTGAARLRPGRRRGR